MLWVVGRRRYLGKLWVPRILSILASVLRLHPLPSGSNPTLVTFLPAPGNPREVTHVVVR